MINLIKLYLLVVTLCFDAFGGELPLNFPQHKSKEHSSNLFIYQKRFGLMGNKNYLSRLLSVGKAELDLMSKYLDKDKKFLINEFHVRVELLLTLDNNKKFDLVNQILEIIQVYQENFYIHEAKYPLKSEYKHAYFKGVIHPYFKRIAISDEQKFKKRHFSINLIDENNSFVSYEQLKKIKDRSRLNPKKSGFWAPADKNTKIYNYDTSKKYESLCTNFPSFEFRKKKAPPENGGGLNPGVKVYYKDRNGKKKKAKIKFIMSRIRDSFIPLYQKQEPYLEPTGNAIMKLLGYNTDSGIYCPRVRMKFDENFFNLTDSQLINTQLWDLEHYYSHLIMKNGSVVKFKDAVTKLSYFDHSKRTPQNPWAKIVSEYHIKSIYKGEIKEILLHGAYIEYKTKKAKRFSSWKKEILSHQDRREVRALGLIDSWLGSTDNFANNLKVSISKTKKKIKNIEFVLSDMGDIFSPYYKLVDEDMGNYPPELKTLLDNNLWDEFNKVIVPYKSKSEIELQINDFTYSIFTKYVKSRKPKWEWFTEDGKMEKISRDIQFMNFSSVKGINKYVLFEDYKWAVRRIAKLSYNQILQALCLSGLGYPGAVLMTNKLAIRRDELVTYFGLSDEIKLLRPDGVDRYMTMRSSGTITVENNGVESLEVIPSYSNYVDDGVFYSKL